MNPESIESKVQMDKTTTERGTWVCDEWVPSSDRSPGGEPGIFGISVLKDRSCADVGGLMDAARSDDDIISYLKRSANSRS